MTYHLFHLTQSVHPHSSNSHVSKKKSTKGSRNRKYACTALICLERRQRFNNACTRAFLYHARINTQISKNIAPKQPRCKDDHCGTLLIRRKLPGRTTIHHQYQNSSIKPDIRPIFLSQTSPLKYRQSKKQYL